MQYRFIQEKKKFNLLKEIKNLIKNGLIFLLGIYFNLHIYSKSKKYSILHIFREVVEEINVKNSNKNDVNEKLNYPLLYNFILDISKYNYLGNWESLNIENNIFKNKNGDIEISIVKTFSHLIDFDNNNYDFSVNLTLNDGKYIDNQLKGNFNFSLSKDFIKRINESIVFQRNLTIILTNITFNYYFEGIFFLHDSLNYKNNQINMTFIPKIKKFSNNINYEKDSSLFSEIYISIKNIYDRDFTLKCYGKLNNEKEYYSKEISNYYYLLSLWGVIQIISRNYMKEGLNLLSSFIYIIWTCYVSALNLLLFVYELRYEFGIIYLLYFFLVNVQITEVLDYTEKKLFNSYFRDINKFKKKMCNFALFFYLSISLFLLNARFILNYSYATFFFFFLTWFGEIFESAYKKRVPKIYISTIYLKTFSQIFILIYFKANPTNFLHLKPSYIKITFIILILLIESLILTLQIIISPNFFIPNFLKNSKNFITYKYIIQLTDEEKENLCSICLNKIKDNSNSNSLYQREENYLNESENHKLTKFLSNLKLKCINYFKKPIIVTQCKHIFHSICLEIYLSSKNTCPICRRVFPKE